MPTAEKLDDNTSVQMSDDGTVTVTYTSRYQALANGPTVKSCDMIYATSGLPNVGRAYMAGAWKVYCTNISAARRDLKGHRSIWEFTCTHSSIHPSAGNEGGPNEVSGKQTDPLKEAPEISFSSEIEYQEVQDAVFIRGEDKNGKFRAVGSWLAATGNGPYQGPVCDSSPSSKTGVQRPVYKGRLSITRNVAVWDNFENIRGKVNQAGVNLSDGHGIKWFFEPKSLRLDAVVFVSAFWKPQPATVTARTNGAMKKYYKMRLEFSISDNNHEHLELDAGVNMRPTVGKNYKNATDTFTQADVDNYINGPADDGGPAAASGANSCLVGITRNENGAQVSVGDPVPLNGYGTEAASTANPLTGQIDTTPVYLRFGIYEAVDFTPLNIPNL